MSELEIKAEITGNLKIGPNPPSKSNELKFEITNQGAEIRQGRAILYFYLTGTLGSSSADLFLNQAEATDCEASYPSSDWQGAWTCPSNTFRLAIDTCSDPILKAGEVVTISFPRVISKTAPGKAKLRFGFGFGKNPMKDCGELLIDKSPDKKEIVAFHSDPPAGSQTLPGEGITLKWCTTGLTDLKLEQTDKMGSDVLPIGDSRDEGSYRLDAVSTTVTFTLSGQPSDRRELEKRELTIQVISPGWYEKTVSIREGDPGFPRPASQQEATALKKKSFPLEVIQLFNVNDELMYAVFRYTYQENEISFLASTGNPFARWNLVESSVPDQDGWIPSGVTTSPGVYFKDHIWLIGGSQIDPDTTSNIVWRLDPRKMVWQKMGAAAWSPRMGHAVLVFKNQIWVMGGRDSSGNALNDIWVSDGDPWNWKRVSPAAPWEGRCLFHPTVWKNRIWLYGGMTEPFSSKLFEDLWVSSTTGDTWQQRKLTGIFEEDRGKGPVASCLLVFKEQLLLFGKFLSIDARDGSELVKPKAYSLSGHSTDTWEPFNSEGLKGWGSRNTFSFQMVNFCDKILVGKALAYDEPNLKLKVYVPQS